MEVGKEGCGSEDGSTDGGWVGWWASWGGNGFLEEGGEVGSLPVNVEGVGLGFGGCFGENGDPALDVFVRGGEDGKVGGILSDERNGRASREDNGV